VAKGYNQGKGIDYDETYAPLVRLEAIRIMLVISSLLNFKLFQMDMKSAFVNGLIKEEVYVEQPPRFKDFESLNHVVKSKKALYGLEQPLRSWYERLSQFFMKSNFQRGKVDFTLLIKKSEMIYYFIKSMFKSNGKFVSDEVKEIGLSSILINFIIVNHTSSKFN